MDTKNKALFKLKERLASNIQDLTLPQLTELNTKLCEWLDFAANSPTKSNDIGCWNTYISTASIYSDYVAEILDEIEVLELTQYELSLLILEVSGNIAEILSTRILRVDEDTDD